MGLISCIYSTNINVLFLGKKSKKGIAIFPNEQKLIFNEVYNFRRGPNGLLQFHSGTTVLQMMVMAVFRENLHPRHDQICYQFSILSEWEIDNKHAEQ